MFAIRSYTKSLYLDWQNATLYKQLKAFICIALSMIFTIILDLFRQPKLKSMV